MNVKQTLLGLLMPQGITCLCCGGVRQINRQNGLCLRCETAINLCRPSGETCERCLLPIGKRACAYCARYPAPAIAAFYAPFLFIGTARAYLHAFKFEQSRIAASLLGREMADSLKRPDYDLIVPVPMNASSRTERGHNQAEILAREISRHTGVPVVLALRRLRNTKQQSKLNLDQRARNVQGAFAARMGMRGMRVLLVDDIRTTGSTAEACAEALLKQGALRCDLVTAAVTPRRTAKHPEGEVF